MSTAWRSARTSIRCSHGLRAQRRVERLGPLGAVEHDAVDEAHHVERRPVDVDVLAQPEGRRHRHRRLADGGDDLVLARHVVGRRQDVAERRPPQHEPRPVAAGDGERQVRPAAGDQRRGERADGPLDVGLQPGADLREIKSFGHRLKVLAPHRPTKALSLARADRAARALSPVGRRRRPCPSSPTPTLTTAPVCGAWTCWPLPRYMLTWLIGEWKNSRSPGWAWSVGTWGSEPYCALE